MLIWPTKRVDEVLDYQIDWTDRLDGEEIVDQSATAVPRGGIAEIERDTAVAGAVQTVWLKGGRQGVGFIDVTVRTPSGRVHEEAVQITVAR